MCYRIETIQQDQFKDSEGMMVVKVNLFSMNKIFLISLHSDNYAISAGSLTTET